MARHERRVPYAGLIAEATEPPLSKGSHAPTCERTNLITSCFMILSLRIGTQQGKSSRALFCFPRISISPQHNLA